MFDLECIRQILTISAKMKILRVEFMFRKIIITKIYNYNTWTSLRFGNLDADFIRDIDFQKNIDRSFFNRNVMDNSPHLAFNVCCLTDVICNSRKHKTLHARTETFFQKI